MKNKHMTIIKMNEWRERNKRDNITCRTELTEINSFTKQTTWRVLHEGGRSGRTTIIGMQEVPRCPNDRGRSFRHEPTPMRILYG